MSARFDNTVGKAMKVEIPAQVKQSCRQRVMAGAEEMMAARRAATPVPVQIRRRRPLLWRPVALAAALMVPLFAGTAMAASQANPDSILYPVKQQMENAREKIALGSVSRAEVEINHAGNRLDEAEKMIDSGKLEYVPDLLARFQVHMDGARVHLEKARGSGDDISRIEALAGNATERYEMVVRRWNEKLEAQRQGMLVAQADLPGSAGSRLNAAGSGVQDTPELVTVYTAETPRARALMHKPLSAISADVPAMEADDASGVAQAESDTGGQENGNNPGPADSAPAPGGKANAPGGKANDEGVPATPGSGQPEQPDVKKPVKANGKQPAAAAARPSAGESGQRTGQPDAAASSRPAPPVPGKDPDAASKQPLAAGGKPGGAGASKAKPQWQPSNNSLHR